MAQLHKFLIGLVFVGMIVAGITIFMSSGMDAYSPSQTDMSYTQFNTSFNKLQNLSTEMAEFKGKEQNTTVSSNVFFETITQPFDVVGRFFTGIYQSAKVFIASTDLVTSMIDDSVNTLPVGSTFSGVLKTGFSLIVLIFIFVGIFLAFVTKSERT